MRKLYLLDTNIISEPLKSSPSVNVIEKLYKNENSIILCSPVWHELIYGMNRLPSSKRKNQIEYYLKNVVEKTLTILPYDIKCAEVHGQLRADLESKGITMPFTDSQIASIALANNLILITRNLKDFSSIQDLKLENWFI